MNDMQQMNKLTENEVINLLVAHLDSSGYKIESKCLGQEKGCDVVAEKNRVRLYVEVKGAKANTNSPTKKREYFDGGQIKTHFGRAIVKALEDKLANPNTMIAIAHPDDLKIRSTIGKLIPSLSLLGIKHFWVSPDANVIEE